MKRLFAVILTILLLSLPSYAWFIKKDKPVIIFRSKPITEINVMTPEVEFKRGERIYYMVTMPKMQYTRGLYIQVVKMDNSLAQMGYNLVWTRDVKLKDEETTYFTDNVVLNEAGAYRMQVYSNDRPTKLFARNEFWVK